MILNDEQLFLDADEENDHERREKDIWTTFWSVLLFLLAAKFWSKKKKKEEDAGAEKSSPPNMPNQFTDPSEKEDTFLACT